MAEHKQAVVIGALGVIGRYIVERLLSQDGWSVIGLSRRTADAAPRYHHIAVDLLDGQDTAAKLDANSAASFDHLGKPAHQAQHCAQKKNLGRCAARTPPASLPNCRNPTPTGAHCPVQ